MFSRPRRQPGNLVPVVRTVALLQGEVVTSGRSSSAVGYWARSRYFMDISVGLALVEARRQPVGPDCLMCAPAAERGGGENGWADGLTGGAVRAGLNPPSKHP